jgi:uncharacterized protein involved in response to NO
MNTTSSAAPTGAVAPPPLLSIGFRPFFLGAGLGAISLIGVWLFAQSTPLTIPAYGPTMTWHGHEMLFGYAAAVIAGFLLTAVRNWTSRQTIEGWPLAALALLWLAARILPLTGAAPLAVAIVDLAFLPLVAIAIARPILAAKNYKNLVVVGLLTLLWLADLAVHSTPLGGHPSASVWGLEAGIWIVLAVIAVIGGRVLPFFTRRGLPGFTPKTWRPIELAAAPTLLLTAAATIAEAPAALTATVATLAAAVHATRLAGITTRRIWSTPLVWVLHVAYAWLAVGLLLHALAALGLITPNLARHALTIGAIGGMTLGMMARVALGHTGRDLVTAPQTNLAFVLANLAVLARVALPIAAPSTYAASIQIAGALWIAAFLIFTATYFPILITPRPRPE